jgi:hypothetical protein
MAILEVEDGDVPATGGEALRIEKQLSIGIAAP